MTYSDMPSAEYNSQLDDTSQDEIKTQEIEQFFPEQYRLIENCKDDMERIVVKQLAKIELKRMIRHEENKSPADEFNDGSPSQHMQNSRDEDDQPDEVIRVFNYGHFGNKDFSITTPRDFQSSLGRNHVGEKTIKEHNFEDNNLVHEDSSLEEIYYSKDSKSNSKNRRNSSASGKRPPIVYRDEGVIHVEGRDNHQIKVPLISLDTEKHKRDYSDSKDAPREISQT